MKAIKCPSCKELTPLESTEQHITCIHCVRQLSVFNPIPYGIGCLIFIPLFLFGRYMMVDVVGGLLESPGGIVVDRQQLDFIMVAGKFGGVVSGVGATALFLFAVLLRIFRGTFLLVRILRVEGQSPILWRKLE